MCKKMRPFEPVENRRMGITERLLFKGNKHYVYFGYILEDNFPTLRIIKIFGGGKHGTDYCAFMNVIDLHMSKLLQFFRHPYDAIKDMAEDEPRRADKSPMTIQGYICDKIIEDPKKYYVFDTTPKIK